jgi:hypothetical protein
MTIMLLINESVLFDHANLSITDDNRSVLIPLVYESGLDLVTRHDVDSSLI